MYFFILEEGLEFENDCIQSAVYKVLSGLCSWNQGMHWNIQVTDL